MKIISMTILKSWQTIALHIPKWIEQQLRCKQYSATCVGSAATFAQTWCLPILPDRSNTHIIVFADLFVINPRMISFKTSSTGHHPYQKSIYIKNSDRTNFLVPPSSLGLTLPLHSNFEQQRDYFDEWREKRHWNDRSTRCKH